MRTRALAIALLLVVSVVTELGWVRADEARGRSVVLFEIRKTENRNRVVFALNVDDSCSPLGERPVFAYWRMIERGPEAREPLLMLERRVYGVARQNVVRGASDTRVDVRLRAIDERTIRVRSRSEAGRCVAEATTTIDGAVSRVDDVLVVQSGPMSVEFVELRGRDVATGTPRVARIDP